MRCTPYYPAGSDDIRSVLQALPQGVTDGLTEIELCLGEKSQRRPEEEWAASPELDPYVGRQGCEILPGIFCGEVLGTYYPGQAKLRINAYVCEKDALAPIPIGFYLRMYMLMTLVHEVAHHYDFSSRIARGRWMADDSDKVEIYAERVQHDWFNKYVVPCLIRDYPDQWNASGAWVRENIGIDLPVKILLGDPRTTARDDRILLPALYNTGRAFQQFLTAVQQGGDLHRSRLEFAWDLHAAEQYEPALQIIELLLRADKDNIDALLLRAEIFNHMERHEEALSISKLVLQRESRWADALKTQVDAFVGLGRYDEAVQAIDSLLEVIGETPYNKARWQLEKAEALIELGRYVEAKTILAWLNEATGGGRYWQRHIRRLRNKCRRHRKRSP